LVVKACSMSQLGHRTGICRGAIGMTPMLFSTPDLPRSGRTHSQIARWPERLAPRDPTGRPARPSPAASGTGRLELAHPDQFRGTRSARTPTSQGLRPWRNGSDSLADGCPQRTEALAIETEPPQLSGLCARTEPGQAGLAGPKRSLANLTKARHHPDDRDG
jgi:hypothetical protein